MRWDVKGVVVWVYEAEDSDGPPSTVCNAAFILSPLVSTRHVYAKAMLDLHRSGSI